MGADKAGLSFRGRTLLTHMRELAGAIDAHPILTGGGPDGDLADLIADAGPVASLCALAGHAAGGQSPARWCIIPVDMPKLAPAPLRRLIDHPARTAYFADHPLPFALTFDRQAMTAFAGIKNRLITGENMSIRGALAALDAAAVAPTADERRHLVNVNTPEEWRHLLQEEK